MKDSETSSILDSLQDELDGVVLYRAMAESERDSRISEVYSRMAAVEQRHADIWRERLESSGVKLSPFHPSWRTRALVWLARRFGPGAVLPSVMALEKNGVQGYSQRTGASEMALDESSHSRVLRQISNTVKGGMEGGTLARIEGRHRAAGGNALRAAVLGANDGLVSNLSLVMGVAGAELSGRAILITGLAGLLAGACSMALGEWLSVQSSRELYQHQISIEAAEIAAAPEEEAEELALIYQARGIDENQAHRMAQQIMKDQASALETMAREELSVDPSELGGSAWEAAITSFVLFALGAIISVIPFIFWSGSSAIITSILFSTIGLFVIGSGITLFTGRSILFSGTRQVSFGLAAAALTFLIGRLIGVNLAG
jgi:VIT1/CCC1 family predicted Fe2+/Mn2+ transporter